MNLNIKPNYQSQNFSAKKIAPKDIAKIASTSGVGIVVGAVVNTVNQNKGMSAEELNGRTQVMSNPVKPNPEVFNQEVSFNYFANGKLKDIPEYVEKGKQRIAKFEDFDKGNKLNTLKYQEQIADKILSESALLNNQDIRNSMYYIVTKALDFPLLDTDEENQHWMNYFEKETQARIKVMDAYAKDEKMKKNDYINKNISSLLCVTNDEQAEMMIELLKNNVDNNDEQFFNNLDDLRRNRISPDLVRKVQSDKRLYDKLDSFVLYNIDGINKEVADKIIQVLDNYLTNYADSELVTEKIRKVLWDSFAYKQQENPVEFAAKMMLDMVEKEKATKTETANDFCERINAKLNDVFAGKYHDNDKSQFDNVNNQIDMIRELRAEIKDAAGKYTDAKSKEALNWTLGTVISRLDIMKKAREHMGWATLGYADITDDETNKEIFEMLK